MLTTRIDTSMNNSLTSTETPAANDFQNRESQVSQRTANFLQELVGCSDSMNEVYQGIERCASNDYSVLIQGDTGTGKELIAKAIHSATVSGDRPFIPVDCSALPATLIESELFGHVRGAFTGAEQSRLGLIETANGGTLFLDEIGEMPVAMQAKFLRVLQERQVRPIGARDSRPVKIRVIAATNRDLEAEVKAGRFRQDLFFRLNVIRICVPPLRERAIDIPLLARFFIHRFGDTARRTYQISDSAIIRLINYQWPGNVRELENAIAHGIAYATGGTIEPQHLATTVQLEAAPRIAANTSLKLEEIERQTVLRVLNETNGDKQAASKILGIGKTTLYRKLHAYGCLEYIRRSRLEILPLEH